MAEKKQRTVPVSDAAADFTKRIQEAYATDGKALALGGAMLDGNVIADARVQVPLAMMNRHGLIAGATGTGKTVTLVLNTREGRSIINTILRGLFGILRK